MTNIGNIIKEQRKLYSLTMEELGDKINTTKGYIFRVEKGELIPGREKLMGLADEFKLDRNKILKIAIEDAMDRAIKRIEDKYYVYKE